MEGRWLGGALVCVVLWSLVGCSQGLATVPKLPAALAALRSPARKITLNPQLTCFGRELVASEEVNELSRSCRADARAACLMVKEASLLSGIVEEQQSALGNFPGPLSVIFQPDLEPGDWTGATEGAEHVKRTGAAALVCPIAVDGTWEGELDSLVKALEDTEALVIPQLLPAPGAEAAMDEASSEELIHRLTAATGHPAVILSPAACEHMAFSEEFLQGHTVVGEVNVAFGQDLLAPAVKELQEKKFSGALLTTGVLPPGIGLTDMGSYWQGALHSLRSSASERFARLRTNIEDEALSAPKEWLKYIEASQKNDLFGTNHDPVTDVEGGGFDPNRGDWVGF